MRRTKYPIPKNTKPSHEIFAREWLTHFNATKAAIAAGYSRKAATNLGYKALKLPAVQSIIERELKRRFQNYEVTQDQIIKELVKIAFSDVSEFVSWDSDGMVLKPSSQLEEMQTGAVAEVIESKKGKAKNVKFRLYDKLKALELLGKYKGLFPDKVQHSGKVTHVNEHTYHIINELVTEPDVASRIRENFRQRVGTGSSQE